jgi:hypothetical protein
MLARYFAKHPKLDWHDLEAQRRTEPGWASQRTLDVS